MTPTCSRRAPAILSRVGRSLPRHASRPPRKATLGVGTWSPPVWSTLPQAKQPDSKATPQYWPATRSRVDFGLNGYSIMGSAHNSFLFTFEPVACTRPVNDSPMFLRRDRQVRRLVRRRRHGGAFPHARFRIRMLRTLRSRRGRATPSSRVVGYLFGRMHGHPLPLGAAHAPVAPYPLAPPFANPNRLHSRTRLTRALARRFLQAGRRKLEHAWVLPSLERLDVHPRASAPMAVALR